ncbi:hypothetical protein Cni_G00133 [Canna indica]|uniref:GATA transcription factor n=1 Tax=Canna indica TaxID=4628 RepID=A0AAQ3JM25_9LILI|nr:hypothetical protein Cni_G00133 [Canna indica]
MAYMDGSDFLYDALYRGGNPQWVPEKKVDQFAIDDLLDFSSDHENDVGGLVTIRDDGFSGNSTDSSNGCDEGSPGNSTDSSAVTAVDESCSNSLPRFQMHHFGGIESFDARLSGDLYDPQIDELAELEWLSNFVEDSFSSEDFNKFDHHISGVNSTSSRTTTTSTVRSEVASHHVADGNATAQAATIPPEALVPGKVRSKRSRPGAAHGSWSSGRPTELPSAPMSFEPELVVPSSATSVGGTGKKTVKPKKKDPSASSSLAPAADGRKCFHCQTDKTPQWRTGPMGPKTLCNACGVRFKSGRLVPEYRPAASPTFVPSEHSNSHRKVLELRRQKELQQQLFHAGGGGASSFYDSPSPVAAVAGEFLIHGHDFRHLNY